MSGTVSIFYIYPGKTPKNDDLDHGSMIQIFFLVNIKYYILFFLSIEILD